MKRILSFTLILLLGISFCRAGSSNKIRKETRFLTDRMAYELDLSSRQYNDVYEINYDFIRGIRDLTPEIILGYGWAIDRYYDYLDMRNEDLRWVLNRGQYNRFLRTECFFRPAYLSGRNWVFRVFLTYRDHDHFYFPKPHHYTSYKGEHCHYDHHDNSYYRGRYSHPTYHITVNIRGSKSYKNNRHDDFRNFKEKQDKRHPTRDDDDDDDDDDNRGWRGEAGRTPAGRGNRVTRPSADKRTERVTPTRPSSSTEDRSVATGIRNYSKNRADRSSRSSSSRSAGKKSSNEKKENAGNRSLRTGSSR